MDLQRVEAEGAVGAVRLTEAIGEVDDRALRKRRFEFVWKHALPAHFALHLLLPPAARAASVPRLGPGCVSHSVRSPSRRQVPAGVAGLCSETGPSNTKEGDPCRSTGARPSWERRTIDIDALGVELVAL